MIEINGRSVPNPETTAPDIGELFWFPDGSQLDGVCWAMWDGDTADKCLLERGLVHDSYEAAFAHSVALHSFTRRGAA